jgi:translation initiation factor 4G
MQQDPPDIVTIQKTSEVYTKNRPKLLDKSEQVDQDELVLREVRYILNRISPKNYTKLAKALLALPINNENRLRSSMSILFNKAITEELYTGIYAPLCKDLCNVKVPSSAESNKNVEFRTLLLDKVKNELEADYIKDIEINALYQVELCVDEGKKRLISKIIEENLFKAKQKTFGNMRFIGELYKLDVIREDEVLYFIGLLLKKDNDEVNIESLCALLNIAGKKIDKPNNVATVVLLFEKFHNIIEKRICVTPRIRFMVKDVIDLRKNMWEPILRSQFMFSQEEIETQTQTD